MLPFPKNPPNLIVIPANFDWADIGEWKAIYHHLSPRQTSTSLLITRLNLSPLAVKKCLVSGKKNKLIGLVGVNNLAVIDTPDALLICNIAGNDSYRVRDLVSLIISRPQLKKYFLSDNDQ